MCRRPAGWGTAHPGQGRCKYHGGRNQQTVVAPVVAPTDTPTAGAREGAYQRMLTGTLTEEERGVWSELAELPGTVEGIEEAIRICTIRELRLLGDVRTLRDAGSVVVEPGQDGRRGMTTVRVTLTHTPDGVASQEVREGILSQVLAIEGHLTRIQRVKDHLLTARAELLRQVAKDHPDRPRLLMDYVALGGADAPEP